jgi:hypothetical protein
MTSALGLTIGKLMELVKNDVVTDNYVEDILNKTGAFFAYDRNLPEKFKRQI